MSYDFRLTRPVGSHGLHCLGEKKAISLCPHSRVESCGIIDDVKNKHLNTPLPVVPHKAVAEVSKIGNL